MSVEVKINGGHHALRKLDKYRTRTNNPEKAWRDVSKYLGREVNKQFRTRGANFGTPWKPLAPSTIMQKRRGGWPRQPLVRTGAMKREFTGQPMDIQRISGKMGVFGSNSRVALWQHRGTRRGGGRHIPARVILRATPKMRRDIKQIVERHVKGL